MEDSTIKIVLGALLLIILLGNVFGQTEDDFIIRQNDEGGITITWYRGAIKQVVIPETIGGYRVTSIGDMAFSRQQLTSVIIPNSVTNIWESAFSRNQLTSVTIPNSVTQIRAYTFADNQLTSVTIHNSVTRIGWRAFAWNQLPSIIFPDSLIIIGEEAFAYNQLTCITIPSSVTRIDERAFAGNQLTSITLGTNVRFDHSSFPNNFYEFYISQDRRAGTYTLNDGIWTVVFEYELCYCGHLPLHIVLADFQPTPPINFRGFWHSVDVDNEFLGRFEYLHTFTHKDWDFGAYHTLVFWTDVPVREFSFQHLRIGSCGTTFYFDAQTIAFTIDELLPTDAFVLNIIRSHYLLPDGGITFIDENNKKR